MLAGMGGTIWGDAMVAALEAARAVTAHGDVPVGAAVLDPDGAIVAVAGNEREKRQDPDRSCRGSRPSRGRRCRRHLAT